MKRYFWLMSGLLSVAQGADAQQSSLKDGLKNCATAYCNRVNYFMAADTRNRFDLLPEFQALFVGGGMIEHNFPQLKPILSPQEYAIALSACTDNTTLELSDLSYCRRKDKPTLFEIHFRQSYRGSYLEAGQQKNIQPLMMTMHVSRMVDGTFGIKSVKKAVVKDLMDPDHDEIPSHCDHCPDWAGTLEHFGGDAEDECGCFTYQVQAPRWKDVSEPIAVKPVRYTPIPATHETVIETFQAKSESKRLIPVPTTYATVTQTILMVPEANSGAVFETISETVLVKEESMRLTEIPAIYETVTQTIRVKAESKRYVVKCEGCECQLETIPAEYRTINTQALRTPATLKQETIPAQYATITRKVVSQNGTGRVLPAEYATFTTQVIKTPATYREETIPAEYRTVTKQVIKTPADCRAIVPPDGTKTVVKKRLLQPARYEKVAIPCGQGTFRIREIEQPARYESVSIFNAQGNIIETRQIEVRPAHVVYEVLKD